MVAAARCISFGASIVEVMAGLGLAEALEHEGLPKREGPKLGETGGGRSGGPRGNAGWGNAGVTPPGLADRGEGSGQEK